MAAPSRPRVSVAVVNWNTRDLLRACLASLPYASPALDLEVIVVDNGSVDGSSAMVRADFPQVILIENTDNLGFTRAANQALACASGDFLFLLNSDAEVRPGCVERLVEVAASDPCIGAVGARLLNPDGSPQASYGPFPRVIHRLFPFRFERGYLRGVEARLADSGDNTADVHWLTGGALLFRRDVLDSVGPLDERFFMWYEDLDFAQRLRSAGLRRVLVGDAEVAHHGGQSASLVDDLRLMEQRFDSEYLYLRAHAGWPATTAVFASRIAKAVVSRLAGPVEARRTAAARLRYHRSRFRAVCIARRATEARSGAADR